MIKKITIFGIIGLAASVSLAVGFLDFYGGPSKSDPESLEETFIDKPPIKGDVIMPTKVSRPGCEEENRCYVPSKIVIEKGKKVTWVNEDSAFHSVTSGFYDAPTDLFDSGYLDPSESYTLTFDKTGIFEYFCTLHPWMQGQVIVQ